MVVAGLADIIVAADFGLAQKYRIRGHRRVGEMVAVTHDELRHGGLVALRGTVAPQPSLLEVRGIDDQGVSHELARRESREAMRSPSRGLRTAIHPDHPVSF